jgi:hypothetical protein
MHTYSTGIEPYSEALSKGMPPHRDTRTGREVFWPSQSGRMYGETQINVSCRFPDISSKFHARDPYVRSPIPGYGRLALPPSPKQPTVNTIRDSNATILQKHSSKRDGADPSKLSRNSSTAAVKNNGGRNFSRNSSSANLFDSGGRTAEKARADVRDYGAGTGVDSARQNGLHGGGTDRSGQLSTRAQSQHHRSDHDTSTGDEDGVRSPGYDSAGSHESEVGKDSPYGAQRSSRAFKDSSRAGSSLSRANRHGSRQNSSRAEDEVPNSARQGSLNARPGSSRSSASGRESTPTSARRGALNSARPDSSRSNASGRGSVPGSARRSVPQSSR